MNELSRVEYRLLQYTPNIICDKSVSLAAIFNDSDDLENGICTLIVAPDWRSKARHLDPDVDLETLEALLDEIQERLLSSQQRSGMIREIEDSFSNVIQVSQRWRSPVTHVETIRTFAERLLERNNQTDYSSFSARLGSRYDRRFRPGLGHKDSPHRTPLLCATDPARQFD